ncbi:MAG: neutral zinc metallopeptidase [bacterium]|nr:neutral zinc metallopeptidase [bacterium]
MRFKDNARLDASQVSDRRGSGSFAGMGGRGMAVGAGGGVVGMIVVLAVVLLQSGLLGGGQGSGAGSVDPANDLSSECRTGSDANASADCQTVATVNSVQSYWSTVFTSNGEQYAEAQTVLFDGQVDTACGPSSSAVGPFYCPSDETVYLDLGFYDALRQDLGAKGGLFAETYVVAHEYGHHVQHLLGFDNRVGSDREGPESGSVRLELQADCLAGVWAANAEATGLVEAISSDDIAAGLDAAAAIGDDRIQQTSGGRVTPESFTHGTSAQRQEWFTRGYRGADIAQCDTWSGSL